MHRAAIVAGVVVVLVGGPGGFGRSPSKVDPALTLSLDGRVWIEGATTLGHYTCAAPVKSTMRTGAEGVDAPLERLIRSAVVTLNATDLECGSRTIDAQLRQSIQAFEHPSIAFTLDSYEVGPHAVVRGRLQIAGIMNGLLIPVTIHDENRFARVSGSTPINLKDWQIAPLSLGALRVDEVATIHFDLTFRR